MQPVKCIAVRCSFGMRGLIRLVRSRDDEWSARGIGAQYPKSSQHIALGMDNQHPADIPLDLRGLISLNIAYQVLICKHNDCCKAVQPSALSEHLRVQHKTPLRIRRQVEGYVKGCPWQYDFSTIRLPKDESGPQPIIPVVDGFQCQRCPLESDSRPFTSTSKKRMRVHGNATHKQKRADIDELFRPVRLQSWFQDRRQRYWVVDESKRDGGSEDVGVRQNRDHTSRSLGEDDGVVKPSPNRRVTVDERGVTTGTRDVEVTHAVILDDDGEVSSAFENSGDEDYRESSGDVGSDNESGSSEAGIDESGDEDYREGSGVADSDEESSGVEIGRSDKRERSIRFIDDDADIAIRSIEEESQISQKKRGKRQLTMDPSVGTFPDSDAEFRRWWRQKTPKRQKRMLRFDDSGVVMGSTQDDDVVQSDGQDDGVLQSRRRDDSVIPPSSPPVYGPVVERRSQRVDDRSTSIEPPNTVVRVVHDDEIRSGLDDPVLVSFSPQSNRQSRLEELRVRLDKWRRTCPACYLAREFGSEKHQMPDCWRPRTDEIHDQAVDMQRHMDKFGGFRGRDGCSSCGVPRAICRRWQVKAGRGWERQQCQYVDMLIPAVVAMLADGSGEGGAVVGVWMDRDGVNRANPAEVFAWYQRERWWADIGMEVARIVRVFHLLVNKNKGVGKA